MKYCPICGEPLLTKEEQLHGIHKDCDANLFSNKLDELSGEDIF